MIVLVITDNKDKLQKQLEQLEARLEPQIKVNFKKIGTNQFLPSKGLSVSPTEYFFHMQGELSFKIMSRKFFTSARSDKSQNHYLLDSHQII